ncbi:MAG: hypothetical protein JNM69_09720 [Archangium sp.]|nr:hypothetical protein [Archangium sp.]
MSQPLPLLERTEQRDFLRTFGRVGFVVAGTLAASHAINLGYLPSALAMGSGAAAMLALPSFAERFGNRLAGHALAALVSSLVAYNASLRGDLPLGALIYLCVVPLVVQYLSGSRAAAGWAVVGVLITAVSLWRVETGRAVSIDALAAPANLARKNSIEAASIMGVLAMMTALAVGLERRRTRVERARMGRLANRLRRLSASVAHEINNPLAWMTSSTSFLKGALTETSTPELQKELADCATDLVDGTRRLSQFSEDLRALTSENTEPASGDPRRVLRLVKSLVGVLATAPAGELPRIAAAEGPLTELLVELLLSSAEQGQGARLAVSVEASTLTFTLGAVPGVDGRMVDELLGPGIAIVAPTATDLSLKVAIAAC